MDDINNVKTYTIKNNFLNTSTKPMPIFDEDHEIIGYVKMFYRSVGEKIFSFFGRPLFINLQAEDIDGHIQIRVIQTKLFFKRAEWKVELYMDQQKEISFILCDTSLITAGQKIAFEFNGRQICMENNQMNRQTRFIDNDKYVIAQCDIEGFPNKDIIIRLFQPELNIYQIAALGLIQYYWSAPVL